MYATFVGQVPTGSLTNTIVPGYNLVGSMVPVAGDLATISNANLVVNLNLKPGYFDYVLFYDSVQQKFSSTSPTEGGMYSPGWINGNGIDPITTNVAEGFFYYNAQGAGVNEQWVESFTINP
jgi:hypothetical protein